jgi:hypothetical protein
MAQNKTFKSNLEQYEDAIASLQRNEILFSEMKNKDTATAIKKKDLIDRLKAKIEELEPIKNEETLSKSCKTFLVKKYVTEKYNRIDDVTDFSMVKGVVSENESISLFNSVFGTNYTKNKKKIDNDFLTGIPDICIGESCYEADEIIDIKTPYDIYSFISILGNDITNAAYWQIQGYMALTNAKVGKIAYCLTNTPQWIIDDELRKLKAKLMGHPQFDKLFKLGSERVHRNMNFDDIPKDERVAVFTVDRDEESVDKIYKKLEKCREFLSEFQKEHHLFSSTHRKSFLTENEED